MKKFHSALIIACLLMFAGCRNFKEVQCTGVSGFKVNRVNTQGIDADILLSVKNPNNMGFSIYPSQFDVSYNGIYLGKARLSKRVRIRANAEEVYAFNLKSDFKTINLADVMKLVSGITGRGMVEVKGDLKAGKLLLRKRFPVHVQERVGF